MNFNWNRVFLYNGAKDDEQGNIRVSNVADCPAIAVKKYGETSWEPLHTLSGANWREHRTDIANSLNNIFKDGDKIIQFKAVETIKNEAVEMVRELFTNLNPESKKQFLEKHKNTYLGKTTCGCCLENCLSGTKVKCINHQCSGMCQKCHDKIGEHCPVCNAEQVVECPICQETKKAKHVCKSATCSHCVCWECYGRAFQANHPILNCPLCRAVFTETNQEDNDEYDSSDDDEDDIFRDDNDEIISLMSMDEGEHDGGDGENDGENTVNPQLSVTDFVASRLQIEVWNSGVMEV